MTDKPDTRPQFAQLLKHYSRDLAQGRPSPDLDARIDDLVATHRRARAQASPHHHRRDRRLLFHAAAAGIAVLAIGVGVFIGMKVEHARTFSATGEASARDHDWAPADLTMWPTDSVSFKIPAEYSSQGTLVAVDPESSQTSTRYWIDVVVANDGTFRIERILPADPEPKKGGHDGVSPRIQ